MSLNLFIIGPSGCGKSTQAKLIAEKYHLTHISTGAAFRHEMEINSPIGIESKKYIDQGIFVPTEILIELFKQEVSKIDNQNFIIDGTPRFPDQCQLIEEYLNSCHQPITALIHLDVTFEEIENRRQRLGQEFQDKNRTDTGTKSFEKRLQEYKENIDPILKYFQDRNKLIRVNGNRPIQPIFEDIVNQIELLK